MVKRVWDKIEDLNSQMETAYDEFHKKQSEVADCMGSFRSLMKRARKVRTDETDLKGYLSDMKELAQRMSDEMNEEIELEVSDISEDESEDEYETESDSDMDSEEVSTDNVVLKRSSGSM